MHHGIWIMLFNENYLFPFITPVRTPHSPKGEKIAGQEKLYNSEEQTN